MATPARFVKLTSKQDESLRELEMSPVVNAKVRLRASIIRLSHNGWTVPKLARHFGRGLQTVHNDLGRFERFGVAGLVDGKAPGNKPSVTPDVKAFLETKLGEDRVWNSTLLGEAIREQFGVKLGREAIRVTLLELGYRWKRTRYAPGKQADPEVVAEHRASLETLKKGALEQRLTLKYLDQSGFSLMLGTCYKGFAKGSGQQFRVPTRWASAGRLNLIGSLSLFGTTAQLEIRELTGSCTQAQVISYLDTLAQSCDPARLTVVVLDNAPFHKGKLLTEQRSSWEAQGLYLRYLPPYCPQLNPIEGIWRRLKGFLMPRRCYNSLAELDAALKLALKALNVTYVRNLTGRYLEEQKREAEGVKEREKVRELYRKNQVKARASSQRLDVLDKHLKALFSSLGTQEGGYEFQNWFYSFLSFYEVALRRPYVTNGRQIDGSVTLSGTTYLVELKFAKAQAASPDIDVFIRKVTTKADNTMGIFVSVSGFNHNAVAEASKDRSPILLLDSSHIYHALSGAMSFAEIVARVRRHASQTGSAYLSINDFSG